MKIEYSLLEFTIVYMYYSQLYLTTENFTTLKVSVRGDFKIQYDRF